jgi:hypothetical protein
VWGRCISADPLTPHHNRARSPIPDFASQQAKLWPELQRYVCAFMMYPTNNVKMAGAVGYAVGGRSSWRPSAARRDPTPRRHNVSPAQGVTIMSEVVTVCPPGRHGAAGSGVKGVTVSGMRTVRKRDSLAGLLPHNATFRLCHKSQKCGSAGVWGRGGRRCEARDLEGQRGYCTVTATSCLW